MAGKPRGPKRDRAKDSVSAMMANFLIEQAEKWSASDLRDKAISMIGEKEYLHRKIFRNFNLWEVDKDLLLELLKV